ncbi:MAG: hypothetical protein JWP91_4730 [Fibrobacteres bacterium]|nr:hypothetical protein [Fibrobacterota bacterium]
MPVTTGHWRAIAIGKPLRAAIVALTILFFALAGAACAQSGPAEWKSLGVKWTPNASWGPIYGKTPTRMGADAPGSLFVSIGDSLYIGKASANTPTIVWKTAPIESKTADFYHTSVTIGGNGTVVWGPWKSVDGGAAWTGWSGTVSPYHPAAAISPTGYCLFAAGNDGVDRAPSLGAKSTSVHFGETFGSIIDFAISPTGRAYAAPEFDDLLVSGDSGKTWAEKQTLVKRDPAAPKTVDLASGLLALEPAYPEESLWMATASNRVPNQVVEYVWSGDSLKAHRHANAGIPDSAITSLKVQRESGRTVLWLGTWGQGVYRSLDRGETWQAFNGGLTDLHSEAMAMGPEGRVYALTEQGMFTIAGSPIGLFRPDRASRSGNASRHTDRFHQMPRYGNAAGGLFRPDGRLSAPALDKGAAQAAP